jgi:large subunit ribosomal protein L24e
MAKCSFCGYDILPGTGMLYVKNDGKQLHFCAKKCEKSVLKMGRKARNIAWTSERRKA